MDTKQVIVVRKDLNMRKGKLAAQVAHASMAVVFNYLKRNARGWYALYPPKAMEEWIEGRFTKIVVSCESEKELFDLKRKADEAGVPNALIQDAGLTEFKEPTYTALGVGPDEVEKVNQITGDLPLL